MSLIEVIAEEVERIGVPVDVEQFVLAVTIGYSVGRRVHAEPGLLQDADAMRRIVRTVLEAAPGPGSRPPLSERPLARTRA